MAAAAPAPMWQSSEEDKRAREKALKDGISIRFMGEEKANLSMRYTLPGVRFYVEVSRCSVVKQELDDPFREIALYSIDGVDVCPLDVSKIPPGAYPYPNCLFVSLFKIL